LIKSLLHQILVLGFAGHHDKYHHKYIIICLTIFSLVACSSQNQISLSCSEENDLYVTLLENKIPVIRYETPEEAINTARKDPEF